MDIVLHLGTHRTGSTTFQAYIRQNADVLEEARVGFWGPWRTRNGLLNGVIPSGGRSPKGRSKPEDRAKGRVQLRLQQLRDKEMQALLVSDENLIGSVRSCLRAHALYPAIGERMARYAAAFGGQITRIAFTIRAQDRWWASALAYGVSRGHNIPEQDELEQICASPRGWRNVIEDLAIAVPEAEIRVMPYESFYANPDTLMRQSAGLDLPLRGDHEWLNRAPDLPTLRKILWERGQSMSTLPDEEGMWDPFSAAQSAKMREKFDDDLFWLLQGADGLATLTEEATPRNRGQAHRAGIMRGQDDDQEGRLDKTG